MKHKLLLAVDATDERSSLCSLLQTHFCEQLIILEAGSGRAALEILSDENPPIAILDIELQDISGLVIAEKIREASKTCAILFLADSDNLTYAKQAIKLRALDLLLKPYDTAKLLHSVEEAIAYVLHFEYPLRQHPLHPLPETAAQDITAEGIRLSLVREDIRTYIDAHYMEELSMKNAAHAMNYSDAYFCKLFKQCFHVNFSTYLNEYRIEKAKQLMKNPRTSIKDISIACGYTDSNYFTRVFKRITGLTPSSYRVLIMEKSLKNENV